MIFGSPIGMELLTYTFATEAIRGVAAEPFFTARFALDSLPRPGLAAGPPRWARTSLTE